MCTCILVGALHEALVCPVGALLAFPDGVPRSHQHPKHQPPVKLPPPQHSPTAGDTPRSHPPSAPSAGKGCSCLRWKLIPVGAGGHGLRVPSHRPWQRCGGRHGRRGGPACPAEVGRERAGAMRSKCARSSLISACLHGDAHRGARQTEAPPRHKGATSSPEPAGSQPFPSRVPANSPRPGQGAALQAGGRAGGQWPRGPAAAFVLRLLSNRKIHSPRVEVRVGAGGQGESGRPFPGAAGTSLHDSRGSRPPSRGVVTSNLVLPFKWLP